MRELAKPSYFSLKYAVSVTLTYAFRSQDLSGQWIKTTSSSANLCDSKLCVKSAAFTWMTK